MSYRGWFIFESHRGAKSPVAEDRVVEVELHDGSRHTAKAGELYWWIDKGLPSSIVKYRPIEYKVMDEIDIIVPWTQHPSLDRALENAMRQAIMRFDVDECGHINNVVGAERSTHSIHIVFDRLESMGGMGGWTHYYHFKAKVVCGEE